VGGGIDVQGGREDASSCKQISRHLWSTHFQNPTCVAYKANREGGGGGGGSRAFLSTTVGAPSLVWFSCLWVKGRREGADRTSAHLDPYPSTPSSAHAPRWAWQINCDPRFEKNISRNTAAPLDGESLSHRGASGTPRLGLVGDVHALANVESKMATTTILFVAKR